jgi:hypothetical protein
MIFIDDPDSNELSLKACEFADASGYKYNGERVSYETHMGIVKGYTAGYLQAIADEKAKYQEALKLIDETHRKERSAHLAFIYKRSKEESIMLLEQKLEREGKELLNRSWNGHLSDDESKE